jgi:hypothetical protein
MRDKQHLYREGERMNFKGKAKRLDDIDLPRLAARIGVGEDEIHAVLDVETNGRGFDAKGRPRMLFEPHVFWRELGKGEGRDVAEKKGLAYPKWRRDYPNDSYPRLLSAMSINEEAALRSASWGLGQIMGFNCIPAGYPSAKAMVQDFLDDEDRHLEAMVTFIASKKLDRFLRARDWKGFALGYNGRDFAANGYDRKLAAAFDKWQRIKDTPWTPGNIVTEPRIADVALTVPGQPTSPPAGKKPGPGFGLAAILAFLLSGAGLAVTQWWESIKAAMGW